VAFAGTFNGMPCHPLLSTALLLYARRGKRVVNSVFLPTWLSTVTGTAVLRSDGVVADPQAEAGTLTSLPTQIPGARQRG
jgi:hypothetical protein